MKKLVILLTLIFPCQLAVSQIKDSISINSDIQSYTNLNGEIYTYKKPKFFEIITRIPSDVYGTINDFGKTNNLIALGSATVLTVGLLPADQYLLDNSRILGEQLGLKDVARYNNFGPLSNIPPNMTSAIYLIGNGTTPILISMGFATFGLVHNDYRSLNTATGIMESLAVSGVFSQTIKRITGRQSPAPAIRDGNPGGDWNPFPSFIAFSKKTPQYDAMPSGHMMTATAALNVIIGNYPDKKWIKPVGYSLIGILGFEMVQANVHWYSDYPIAMVIGYLIGKNIVKSKVTKSNSPLETPKKYTFNINASRRFGYNLIAATVSF